MPGFEAEGPPQQAFLEAAPIATRPLVRIPSPPLHFALVLIEYRALERSGLLPLASPDGGTPCTILHCRPRRGLIPCCSIVDLRP
jgi:hypothetical protein